MKVFTSTEIKFLEQCTVESGTSMTELMEKAGSAVTAFIKKQTEVAEKSIVILCGKGNNGGDGFVCARRLSKLGARVIVVLAQGNPGTALAQEAFQKMGSGTVVLDWNIKRYEIEGELEHADIIVDAIFGLGFRGAVDSIIERLISTANKGEALRIAIDLPSGAECDTGKVEGCCFTANYTVTFTSIKPANVIHPATGYCGKNVVASVGIDKRLFDSLPSTFSVIKENTIYGLFRKRNPQSNKGSYGRLIMICGSYGMIGAAIMAARGALRCGVGLLNMVVGKECYPLLAAAVPEAIFTIMDFSTDERTKESGELLFAELKKATACVIGCGLGSDTARYLSTVLHFAPCPVVVDADGINYLAENLEELTELHIPVILTPHPGEMARLTGKTVLQIQMDRLTAAKRFATEYQVYTVLKGAGTFVASPDGDIRLNTTGNSGMAKGGSGDVLAGMIGSLLAQGMSPAEGAAAAVHLHGKAGDICAKNLSQQAMLPTDLIEKLPEVFLEIEKHFSGGAEEY
ncbi:MAG: NAD(P)H-hydrate dehydratase [Oscillospiraceae bacterium]